MTITNQADDTLTLSLAKQHLYVDFANDDVLIQLYIDASLQAVKDYTFKEVQTTTYTSITSEITTDAEELYHVLRMPYKPDQVSIIGTTTETLFSDEIQYDPGEGLLYVPNIYDNVTSITALCNEAGVSVLQARLLLVGTYYGFRESSVIGNLKELPSGVKFLLDMQEKSVW